METSSFFWELLPKNIFNGVNMIQVWQKIQVIWSYFFFEIYEVKMA